MFKFLQAARPFRLRAKSALMRCGHLRTAVRASQEEIMTVPEVIVRHDPIGPAGHQGEAVESEIVTAAKIMVRVETGGPWVPFLNMEIQERNVKLVVNCAKQRDHVLRVWGVTTATEVRDSSTVEATGVLRQEATAGPRVMGKPIS